MEKAFFVHFRGKNSDKIVNKNIPGQKGGAIYEEKVHLIFEIFFFGFRSWILMFQQWILYFINIKCSSFVLVKITMFESSKMCTCTNKGSTWTKKNQILNFIYIFTKKVKFVITEKITIIYFFDCVNSFLATMLNSRLHKLNENKHLDSITGHLLKDMWKTSWK